MHSWTIYHHPGGAPPYTAVEWLIHPGGPMATGKAWGAGDLPGARALIPARYDFRMPRADTDAPEIVETWL